MKTRISLVGFHVVTPALLPLVPIAERETPGLVLFRGYTSGNEIPIGDIFHLKKIYLKKQDGLYAMYLYNLSSELVGVRVHATGSIPNQIEIWSRDLIRWVPYLVPEPVQLFIPRAPGAYITNRT